MQNYINSITKHTLFQQEENGKLFLNCVLFELVLYLALILLLAELFIKEQLIVCFFG